MKTATVGFSLLGAVALMATGCVSTAPIMVEKRDMDYRVDVNSLILDNHIRVTERVARKVNQLLEVQIRGQNISRRDIQLEYRFIWLDGDGIALGTPTSVWKPLNLHARETALMYGIASSPDAEDFLMSVRFVGKSTRW